MIRTGMIAAAVLSAASMASAAVSLTPMTTFGGGDGWRAPGEVVAGDTAGTAGSSGYNYLQTTSLERGMAFNRVTGNLVLVSRSTAGNGLRLLNGLSGADVGFLNQGSGIITGGGLFTTSTAAVADDGQVYVSSLNLNVGTGAHKIYQWASEGAAAPTTLFNSTISGFTGTPRLGDSLDAIGSGAGTTLVAGTSGVIGYVKFDVGTATATAVSGFAPTGPTAGDFRLGITFAGSASEVWGKQTGAAAAAAPLRRTSHSSGAVGTFNGSSVLTSGSEAPMDYAVIEGVPYLAVLTTNTLGTADSTTLRIYDVTNPATPLLVAGGENTTGTLATNGNATGAVAFGVYDAIARRVPVYAMSSNHGIQAFYFNIPEPATLGLLAGAGLLALRRRK